MAITAERLVAVVQPLKVATLSTNRRARRVIFSLTLICFVLAAFPLWTVGLEEFKGMPTCVVLNESYESWLIAVVVVMTLTLPIFVLIISTAVIVYFLTRSQHFRTKVCFFLPIFLYEVSIRTADRMNNSFAIRTARDTVRVSS